MTLDAMGIVADHLSRTSAGEVDGILAQLADPDETASQLRERLGYERRTLREQTGERRLQLALVEQAIKDMIAPEAKTTPREVEESRIWILCTYDSHPCPDVGTFDGCCLSLGLDPDMIRDRVFAIAERRGEKPRLNFAALGDNRRRRRPRIVPRKAA